MEEGRGFPHKATDNNSRDVLPVVIICSSHSSRMSLLNTATGDAKLFNLARPRMAVVTEADEGEVQSQDGRLAVHEASGT